MSNIRCRQSQEAGLLALTLRYHRYGGLPLNDNEQGNPHAKLGSTYSRLCRENGGFEGGCEVMAINTRASYLTGAFLMPDSFNT